MDNLAFFNGKFLPETKIKIDCRDLGLLRGYGVFDFMIASGTRIHRFQDHYNRFLNSARAYNLKHSLTETQTLEAIKRLLVSNGFAESAIRLVLTGGTSSNGRTIDKETFLILIDRLTPYPQKYYDYGVKIITKEFQRDNPEIKALNYQFAYSLYQVNTIEDAFEIIYTTRGNALEGATSNIFIVKDNVITTPKTGILPGITRKEVIELAKKYDIAVLEKEITQRELIEADEVFITATTKKIMPVSHIDGRKTKGVCPGPLTKKLMGLYSHQDN